MQKPKKNKISKFFTFIFFIAIILFSAVNIYFYNFPREIKIIEGREQRLEFKIPLTFELFCKDPFLNPIKDLNEPLVLQAQRLGTYDLEFRWLGFIPVKKMRVHVLPETRVVPGGHSLGVKLRPDGVIVVGFASVIDEKGLKRFPAQEAGIEVGDVITMVNNKKINQAEEFSRIVNHDKNLTLSIKRNNKILQLDVNSIKTSLGQYQIGLWVRDIAAGVGTLTFYDPVTGFYGALGHIISDTDTGKSIEVGEGEIIRAKVTNISPARKNQPGEKKGVFVNEEHIMGNIMSNTPFGIFGKAYKDFHNPYYPSLPVATMTQVHEGHAKILTVLEGEKIQEYDIEIQKIIKQSYPNGKGMIIKITDPKLLSKTGGIVQGMSGSPIIQDGYIIGAVTHVFVNDPTKGYGIFIEWMLNEIEKLNTMEKI